ncbi:hypothetical protein H0H81_005379 [Sphagnurus paluster]|uniref:UBA domain-containing protein n=1 Tax=Sphagnurus paluster TaxID=117069 RepID=A0A9P7K6Y0_9AGAR|nr:hypothetical protein H0H81_005379 [Sphagnurus paluster]
MTPDEQEAVSMLTGMMGGDVELEQVLRVLRKNNGDVQKAADAILSGDRGEETTWKNTTAQSNQGTVYYDASSSPGQPSTQASTSAVIDLTSADSDNRKSWPITNAQTEVMFGPSERAPEPSWQMVTTNTPVDAHQDDRSLKDAIQASLEDFTTDDLEMLDSETHGIREGGRCFLENPERTIYFLVELFTNLDLAQLSSIVDKEVLPLFEPAPWNGSGTDALGELSAEFLRSIGILIDTETKREEESQPYLFHFKHARVESKGGTSKIVQTINESANVVNVEVGDNVVPNDLVSRLSNNLSQHDGTCTMSDVIVEPMEVVAFHLKTLSGVTPGPGKPPPEPFIFPKHFYLDRFLLENVDVAEQKRTQEREMQAEIEEMTKKRDFITRCDNRDTLTDLRASLYYYEHVAESKNDPDRQAAITRTTEKLRSIVDQIVKTVQDIDQRVAKLQTDLAVVFDCPELQQYRYDLRSVFIHTGLPGRKQIYSYVQDAAGVWWKTIDYNVTEVPEETVLTDPTGLHMGAGPYLLIYSRHLPQEEIKTPVAWPTHFVDAVQDSNAMFLKAVRPKEEEETSASSITAPAIASVPSVSFPFSPAVFPERVDDESQPSMDVDVQTQVS